jgi:hypothetical protein
MMGQIGRNDSSLSEEEKPKRSGQKMHVLNTDNMKKKNHLYFRPQTERIIRHGIVHSGAKINILRPDLSGLPADI